MKNRTYKIINFIVLLVTAVYFVYKLCTKFTFMTELDSILVILFATVLVHLLKGFRLYIILCESDISLSTFVKTYCKVIPVSMILPYKLGELYRMYCFGVEVKNYVEAVVVVLFDRLADTLGLVTLMFTLSVMFGVPATPLLMVLTGALVVLFVLYFSFPGIYKFWNHHLLEGRSTERRLMVLHFLSVINQFYREIRKVSQGRWIVLFVLSGLAWICETGTIFFIGRPEANEIGEAISGYLQSSLGTQMTVQFSMFLLISFVLLIGIYLIIRLLEGKKGQKG